MKYQSQVFGTISVIGVITENMVGGWNPTPPPEKNSVKEMLWTEHWTSLMHAIIFLMPYDDLATGRHMIFEWPLVLGLAYWKSVYDMLTDGSGKMFKEYFINIFTIFSLENSQTDFIPKYGEMLFISSECGGDNTILYLYGICPEWM